MPNRKEHESMMNLEKCYSIVQQSSTKGISAVEVAKKIGKHRSTIHGYLTSLELMGKVESQHGTWHAKTGEQPFKSLEKEIVIELPIPKDQWQLIALLEAIAKKGDEVNYPKTANTYRIFLEKFMETRTIRIKGKNVDDLDLEKMGNLIKEANEKSSKVNLRGLFKSLKKSRPNSDKPSF